VATESIAPGALTDFPDQTLDPGARRIFLANLIAQMAIVLTGGLVRVTSSGLGCPTWPQCVPGSLVPTASQAQAWHKYIEFGNRTLTFVLVVLAVAALYAAVRANRQWRASNLPPRKPILWLAAAPLIGTVAQALLGGVTVLTGLSPLWVGAHLLLSVAIIAACVVLVHRAGEPGDLPRTVLVRPELLWFGRALVAVALSAIAMGTLVTGSGPHSGDIEASHRLPFDVRTLAWLHADIVLLFVGLIVGMWLGLRLTDGPARAQRWVAVLAVLALVQGIVGYTQWFTGVPWALVAFHMLMATLVWVSALELLLSLRVRGRVTA
jgi:cytochrome c oxidase assembly protein subunit 15